MIKIFQKLLPEKMIVFTFILLSINILFIALPHFFWYLLTLKAKAGVSGTEYLGFLLLPFIWVGYVVAAMNAISIPIALLKYKPHYIVVIVGLLIALASAGYGASALVSIHRNNESIKDSKKVLSRDEATALIYSCQVESMSMSTGVNVYITLRGLTDWSKQRVTDYKRTAKSEDFYWLISSAIDAKPQCGIVTITSFERGEPVASKELTLDEATEVLSTCKVRAYTYVDSYSQKPLHMVAERSKTGIILDSDDDGDWVMYITENVRPQTEPIIQNIAGFCGSPRLRQR